MTVDVGALVECETLEGETMTAVVVRVLDDTAADHEIELDDEPVSIWRFWGRTIPEDDRVVRVRPARRDDSGEWVAPSPRSYDYPVSRLETIESAVEAAAVEGVDE